MTTTSRAVAFTKTPNFKKLWRYAVVSVISTVMTQLLLFITFDVMHLAHAWVCNIIATVVSSVPAYYLNRNWAWGKTGRSHLWREVVPFWTVGLIGLAVSTGAVALAEHNAKHFTHTHDGKALLIQAASLFAYAIIWVGKFLIFNHFLFKHHPAPEDVDGSSDPMAVSPASATAS